MARADARHRNRLACGGVAAFALALTVTSSVADPTDASAAPAGRRAARAGGGVEIMPVDELKPGMKGYAVTVFKGTGTDRFEIEVVDTMKNYLPKQDAVLFTATDPRLEHSGIVGGMSGSPIYVEGKLVGALSYGWRFNKDPLGALTPISNMREVGDLPYRPDVLPRPTGKAREGVQAWSDSMLGLGTTPLPARRKPVELDRTAGLEQLTAPMSVSGLSASGSRALADLLGLEPVRGGSGRTGDDGDAKARSFAGGDSVSVVMVRGDSSVAANGTVTWVSPKGDRLLAFGHSMFNDGPTNGPFADARVHTILASMERSVKMSSPLTIQGLMYQDRQAAIALRTDARAPMIPLVTTIQGPDPDLAPRTYKNEVAVGVNLTPNLVGVVLGDAVDEAGRDATEVVVKVVHDITLDTTAGSRELHLEEEVFFPQGVVGRMLGGSRGVITVAAALENPFEVARIRKIENRVVMDYGAPIDTIQTIRMRESEVHAGDVIRLDVILRSYKGAERTEVLPLRIPDDAGGEEVQIEVTGGDMVRPYRPLPGDLDDLLTTLEQGYPSRTMVASIYREREGLSTKEGLLNELPDSVLETLAGQSSTQHAVRFKQLARRVIPTKNIIEGQHTIRIDVLPRKR